MLFYFPLERSHIALAVVGKRLISLSVVQRVMTRNGHAAGDVSGVSEEKGHNHKLQPLAEMKTSRCAFGAASYGNNIVVAGTIVTYPVFRFKRLFREIMLVFVFLGGYNRGECLSSVEVFDPETNRW